MRQVFERMRPRILRVKLCRVMLTTFVKLLLFVVGAVRTTVNFCVACDKFDLFLSVNQFIWQESASVCLRGYLLLCAATLMLTAHC